MPTITFTLEDLRKLSGKHIDVDDLHHVLEYAKAEFEEYDKDTDEITISCSDTNQPYLWSVEGVARLLRGVFDLAEGMHEIKTIKGTGKILVDPSIKKIRPFIVGFRAKGNKIDDHLIKQIIQLQEKFCDTYGRKRAKVSIGVYTAKTMKFPLHYKAVDPESLSFVPLEFKREMTMGEILEEHPTGVKYAHLLSEFKQYPIFMDDDKKILSFPPIINSNDLGRVEVGDDDLLVEFTGTDEDAVLLAGNIFAAAFYDRGFSIETVETQYSDGKNAQVPHFFNEMHKITEDDFENLFGMKLRKEKIEKLLKQMRYDVSNLNVTVPYYRQDIMHVVDILEDIAVAFGYNNLPELPLQEYTVGESLPIVPFANAVRDVLAGLGFQEVVSAMLTNKEDQFEKMCTPEYGCVELKEYMSETYSVMRSWILPVLMSVLSKNRHIDYPQNLFEEGLVCVKKDDVVDYRRVAVTLCDKDADFTRAKQVLDAVLRALDIEYEIKPEEHSSFSVGRCARVYVNGNGVAYIGEMSPYVLEKWGLTMPVAGFELNLSDLFEQVR